MVGGKIVTVHLEASITLDRNSHFTISGIMILKPRWGENSQNEKPQNIMQDECEVMARSCMGWSKRTPPRGSREFVLATKEGIMVSRHQV